MSSLGEKIEAAIAPAVAAMEQDFKSTARSEFGQRRNRNRIKGKVVPRLQNTFKPRVTMDADGWGLIRFRTTRHAYILHYGHAQMSVTRKWKKRGENTYTKGHIKPSLWLNDVANRNLPAIAEAASKVTADFAVKELLPTPKVL